MTKYIEFIDEVGSSGSAVELLNTYIEKHPKQTLEVISHQVVRYEGMNKERTYILAKVTE